MIQPLHQGGRHPQGTARGHVLLAHFHLARAQVRERGRGRAVRQAGPSGHQRQDVRAHPGAARALGCGPRAGGGAARLTAFGAGGIFACEELWKGAA